LEKKINKKIASCKNYTRSHIKVHKPHPISDQNGQKIYTLFQTKKAKKPYPLVLHIPIREYPPGFNTPLKNGEISMPTLYRQLDFTDGQRRDIDAFIIQTVSTQHGEILISSLYRQLLFATDQRRDIDFIIQTTSLCHWSTARYCVLHFTDNWSLLSYDYYSSVWIIFRNVHAVFKWNTFRCLFSTVKIKLRSRFLEIKKINSLAVFQTCSVSARDNVT